MTRNLANNVGSSGFLPSRIIAHEKLSQLLTPKGSFEDAHVTQQKKPPKVTFNDYVDTFLPFMITYLPLGWHLTLQLDKDFLLNTYPPRLVNVVIERPQRELRISLLLRQTLLQLCGFLVNPIAMNRPLRVSNSVAKLISMSYIVPNKSTSHLLITSFSSSWNSNIYLFWSLE